MERDWNHSDKLTARSAQLFAPTSTGNKYLQFYIVAVVIFRRKDSLNNHIFFKIQEIHQPASAAQRRVTSNEPRCDVTMRITSLYDFTLNNSC